MKSPRPAKTAIPPGVPPEVSINALCWLLDLSAQRISVLEREGIVQKVARNSYSTLSVPAVVRAMRVRGEGPVAYTEARTRWLQERARGAQLVREEKEGKLVPVDQVAAGWAELALTMRSHMLSLPSRIAARVGMAKNAVEVQQILRREIEDALSELSKVDVVIAPSTPGNGDAAARAGSPP